MRHLSVFSWGFWGWGTATGHLVQAFDAAERQRGFNPPMFVDIRLRRQGRAPGFKGNTFESLVGWRRYRWMPTLGNSSIVTKKRATKIACPDAANQLLDLVLEAADRSSRVIFFCACESPWATYCHRHEVAKLLVRWARRRHVSIDVHEWPGERPSARSMTLRVSPQTLRGVARGAKAVPLNRTRVPAEFAGIPWGTLLMLRAGREEFPVAVGPAAYQVGRWVLPRFQHDEEPADDAPALRRQVSRLRRYYGLD